MEIISCRKYKHLKAWRKHFKLSQEKLADIIGTNQPNINRWENGIMAIDDETFENIAFSLGITPLKLMASPNDAATIDFLSDINDITKKMDKKTKMLWISLGKKLIKK